MWIPREISKYIQRLLKKRPCVLLTGARQTGKSSLLEKTFPDYHYITLDLPHIASSADKNGSYFLEKYKPPIIIDEIQYAPNLFRFLKIEIDKQRKSFGRYLLSGSQKFSLMKGVRESLSGRMSILECHSLSVRELYQYSRHKWTSTQVLKWMVKGGYPEVYAHHIPPERFYADYTATYLERDVRQLIHVRDLALFNNFLRLLAVRSGQVVSMSALSRDLGMSVHTIKSWISILTANNIVYLLKPFYNNYGKRLVKAPKLYFLDTGLLCFLAGIHHSKVLEDSTLLGSFFETFCLGQLIRHFCNQGQSQNLYYFRDNHGHEVDFIIPEGNKLNLYECKWQYQSGSVPDNVQKMYDIVGRKNIKISKVITSAKVFEKIDKKCLITNLVDL